MKGRALAPPVLPKCLANVTAGLQGFLTGSTAPKKPLNSNDDFSSRGKSHTLCSRYLSGLPYSLFSDTKSTGWVESDCVFNLLNYLKHSGLATVVYWCVLDFYPEIAAPTVKVTVWTWKTHNEHIICWIFRLPTWSQAVMQQTFLLLVCLIRDQKQNPLFLTWYLKKKTFWW